MPAVPQVENGVIVRKETFIAQTVHVVAERIGEFSDLTQPDAYVWLGPNS